MAEGESLAVGVSTRMFGVMDVGSLRTEATQSPEEECFVWTVEGETFCRWGLDSSARSDGWRLIADCGAKVTRGGRCYLGSWGLDSCYQCDGRRFDEFTQERAWHPCDDMEGRRRALHGLGDSRNDLLIALSLCSSTKPENALQENVPELPDAWVRCGRDGLAEPRPSPLCEWERLHTLVHSQRRSLLYALPNVAVSQWHLEETHPTLPHVNTGFIPCPV